MPVWPVTLPQDVLIDGYDEKVPEMTLRTQMDAGPAKVDGGSRRACGCSR